MRKILYFSMMFLLILGLSSCKEAIEDPESITASVVSEIIAGESITIHVVLPISVSDAAEINEIILSIASQTYEKHFDRIGTDRYQLTVTIYESDAAYTAQTSLGQQIFIINDNLEHPGLSIVAE
jgi:hypothetical protein